MPCTSDCCSSSQPGPHTTARYRKVLWAALAINFGMFIIEIVMSARSGSVSLMSDSLDFLGDAGNYLISSTWWCCPWPCTIAPVPHC